MTIRVWFRAIGAILTIGLLAGLCGGEVLADDTVTYNRKGAPFEDVRDDLENAIITEGLKIDYRGNLAAMLERTGPDVGSNQPIYRHGEFVTFCSAKLSRAMMEADPANISQCPYVMFIYQRVTVLDTVVVGYRKVNVQGPGSKSLEEINKLLERVARSASK